MQKVAFKKFDKMKFGVDNWDGDPELADITGAFFRIMYNEPFLSLATVHPYLDELQQLYD